MSRRGRGTILRELRKHASLELANFNDINDRAAIMVDGVPTSADAFIKERTRIYRESWILPLIDELLKKEQPR